MKNRVLIKDLKKHINKTVIVKGFVDTIRDQKRMQFLVLRDHSGKAQLLHMKSKTENDSIASVISSLTAESSIIAKGVVVEAPQVKLGGLEIQISSIQICNKAETPLPITHDSNLDETV